MNDFPVVGDGKDGKIQVWVTDPAAWVGARLVVDYDHYFRSVDTMRIDGFWVLAYYGGDPSNPDNHPDHTQFHYYDNFIISTDPITHT